MAGSAWSNQPVIAALVEIIAGVPGTGLFMYSGTPAKGNLVMSIAPASGTDAFGNNYGQGFNLGVWSASTGNQAQHFGIDNNGKLYLIDSGGNTRIFSDPSVAAQLIYDASGQVANHISASIASVAGTDSVGNNFPQGIASFAAGNPATWVRMFQQLISFHMAADTIDAFIGENGDGSLSIQSAARTAAPFESSLTLNPAATGVTPQINVIGVLEADTWHSATSLLNAGYAAGSPAPRYRQEPQGSTGYCVRLDGQVNLTAAQVSGATIFILPAGYRPANDHFFCVPATLSGGFNNGFLVKVLGGGNGSVQQVIAGSNGNDITLDGIVIPLD